MSQSVGESAEEQAAREAAELEAARANETPEEREAREAAEAEAAAAAEAERLANETPEEREAREAVAAEAERQAGETPEERQAREAAEAEDAEFKKLPIGVQKRIGKLLAKQRELEGQVAAAQQEAQQLKAGGAGPRGQTSGPLESITDLNQLGVIAGQTESALDELTSLQKKLSFAPGRVEAFLKEQKVVLKDAEGNEDYTPERMADVLDQFERTLRTTLRAVPQRAQYLQNHAKAHEGVVKQFPWMTKQGDPKAALLSAMANANPAVKAAPDYEYWLACAVEKHMEIEAAKAAAAKTGKPGAAAAAKIAVVVKPGAKPVAATAKAASGASGSQPNTGTVGTTAPKVNPDKVKLDAAKAEVMKGGGRAALAKFMGATGRF